MAARVNRNFVLVLVFALVAVVAVGFLAYFKLYHRTADQLRVEGERHLVEARRHAAEVDTLTGDAALSSYRRSGEEFKQATRLFGQAFTKEPTNLEVLQNYIDSLEQMHASNVIQAGEFHRELLNKRKLAVELSGSDPGRLDAYFKSLVAMAPWQGPGVYDLVFREAENRLAQNPTDAIAQKYRGIVGALRLDASSDLNQQRAALDDLQKAREQQPEDPELALSMAGYQLFEAERVQADEPAFDAAMDAAFAALDRAEPASEAERSVLLGLGEARLRAVRLLRRVAETREQQGAGAQRVEAIQARAEELEAALEADVKRLEEAVAADPAIDDVVRTADLLTATDRTDVRSGAGDEIASTGGLQRTEALVQRAVQAEPLNVSYKVMLGNLLRLRQQHDEALAAYREADALEPQGPAEMMLRTDARRRQARFEIASIELIKAESAPQPEERERLLKGAEAAVEELVNAEDRTARVLLLEGKIALLRNETTKAMQALDKAVEMYASAGQPNVEAILLSARARQSERQWGAASERLEELLRRYPLERSPSTERRIRRQLTEIYLAAGQPEDARRQIDRLAALSPDDDSTAALQGQLALEDGRVDEAAGIFRDSGLLGNAAVVRQLAAGYRGAGQDQQAEELLRGFLAENPGDVTVLAELLPRVDAEERDRLLAAAGTAGTDPETMLMLRGSEDPADRQRIVDTLAERGGGSDLDEQLRRASLWERLQEPEKAAAAYERARAIDPDSSRLLMEDLRAALAAGDMEEARTLAERASRENLDLAGGRFIRGQVAAAEGDTGRAIVLYREGLQERPVYDQGWKTLGDLHLREGAAAEASEAYAQATRQRPDNVGALLGLAEAQRQRGREGAALAALRSAVDVNPDNTAVREQYLGYEARRGDPQRAIDFRREQVRRRPEDLGNRIGLARLLQERGNASEAMKELDAAAEQPSAGPAVAAARAELLAASDGPEAGLAAMNAYLAERGEAVDAADFTASGRFLAGQGRNEEATASFRRAVALEPADDEGRPALRELGDHLFATGRAPEAAEVYRDLLSSDDLAPADRERVTLRQAETLLRAGDAEAAEALLAAPGGGEPGVEALLLRAMIARQRDDLPGARAAVASALQADPGSAAAYLQRAMLPDASPADALADAERAAELSPGNAAADRLRVGLLLSQGRRNEAAAVLAEQLEGDPSDGVTRIRLVELRLAEGREDEARRLVDAGRRLDATLPVWEQVDRQIAAASDDDAVAIPALRAALAERPDAATLARLVGRLLGAGDAAAAGEALDAEPGFVQENPVLQAMRGRSLAGMDDEAGARNVLRLALSRARSAGELSGVLSEASEALGPEGAVALSDEEPPALDPALVELVQASVLSNAGLWQAVVDLLESGDDVGDGEAGTRRLRTLATALQNVGRAEEAGRRYAALLAESPRDVASLNNYAYLLASDLGRPAEAVPLAERAVEALGAGVPAVQRASVLDTLGWVRHLSGESATARGHLEESLRLSPLPAAHLHLAHVYRALDLGTLADDQARKAEAAARSAEDQRVIDGLAEFRAAG